MLRMKHPSSAVLERVASRTDWVPLGLMFANLLGIGIGYATTVVLARNLSHYDFEQYAGTIATLSLVAAFGEAGFGKYALQAVPGFVARGASRLLVGYVRYAVVGCIALSLLLGAALVAIEIPLRSGRAERVALMAIAFLPALAGFGVAVDLLLALRVAALATVIARVVVPMATLGLIVFVLRNLHLTSYSAVLCYCTGSLLGFGLALLCVYWILRTHRAQGAVETQVAEWMKRGLSFLAFGFLISWLIKAPIVLAHHLPHELNELALLVPAFEAGCVVLLLSKSTDKYYQPALSMVIESGNWTYGEQVGRQRYVLLGSGVCVFLLVIFVFGQSILSIYGDDFTSAYPALCVIAVGSSFWTMFSLAPAFLLFIGKHRVLLLNLLGHGALLSLLTAILFPLYGVMGAAIAYALAISSLATINFAVALQIWRSRREYSL